jgi:phytoene desaturase
MMLTNKTIAVIGGGVAGLAAARRLCLEGATVKLFEANDKLGGCCATTRLDGYTFNDGALFLAFPGMLDQVFGRLNLERATLVPLRRISALQSAVLPDGTSVIFDVEAGVTVKDSGGKDVTAGARKELAGFLQSWDPLLELLAEDILLHPLSLPRFIARAWRQLHLMRGTAGAYLNRAFSHEATRAAMSAALLYTGMPPDGAPAIALLSLAAMFRHGYFIPEGGMGSIPQALGQALRRQGGDIHLQSNVSRILLKSGRVCGIETQGGDVVEVDAVISTTSGMHTFGSLLSGRDVPGSMARKLRRAVLSHKGFVLQLGLSNRIDVNSYSNNVVPLLGDQRQLFMPPRDALRWPIYMVPTIAMPELAPPGGSIVEMFPPIRQDLAAEDWSEARKEEIAAQAVDRLKGMHEIDIATRRIRSPKEFQDDTHLYAGALYGLSPIASPTALFKYRGPVRGLYLAGQTTWPGFGVASAGMSGIMAAEALIGAHAS